MKECGNKDCCVSTGICESLTFGYGKLDAYGYWEYPCGICAREHEKKYPNEGLCWPFPKEIIDEYNAMVISYTKDDNEKDKT